MPPFDLEQGKLSVRVSEGVYYQLLADIDDFGSGVMCAFA